MAHPCATSPPPSTCRVLPSRAPRPSRRPSRAARPSRLCLWPYILQLCPERRSVCLEGLPYVAPIPLETADPAGFADQAFPSRHRWTPRWLDIVTRSPTVTANHGSERGLITRGSTGRISVDWFIAPFGRVDMTDNRSLLRQRVWIRGRRHGGGRQNGGKSKPCKQGCGAATHMLEYLFCKA